MTPIETDFAEAFGGPPELIAEAPGRVNLLGEHTDYNGGYVLPTVIPQRTRIGLRKRSDGQVAVVTATLKSRESYRLGAERQQGDWLDYIQGVTLSLLTRGHELAGFDALVASDIPIGSGLSSSAALEVALLRGLKTLFHLSLDDLELARCAQWGENHVVGAPVGILDPMACHFAREQSALLLDTRSLDFESLPLPPETELVVVDSGVAHAHAGGGYRTRRTECEQAALALGVPELRDIGEDQLPRLAALPAPLDRRARHVVTENARVLRAAAALKADDARELGLLFNASHASMRDDFEVSVPEVDAIVAGAQALPDVYGARLTGGGFGGAVVCLVKRGSGRNVGGQLAVNGARLLVPQER